MIAEVDVLLGILGRTFGNGTSWSRTRAPTDLLFRILEPLRALKGLSFGYLGLARVRGLAGHKNIRIQQTMVSESLLHVSFQLLVYELRYGLKWDI